MAFRGNGLRDLAYFVTTALSAELLRAHEDEILDIYLAELAAGGVELDRDVALREYALFALDAAMATLVQGSYNHDLAATRRNLECVLSVLIDHDVLGRIRSITGSE